MDGIVFVISELMALNRISTTAGKNVMVVTALVALFDV